jgi:hypothetical protein
VARLLFLFFVVAIGCHSASPGAAARCDVAGDWSANLMNYDGTARLTAGDGDALRLVLVGKATQDLDGRRLDARHLTFYFPSGEARCEVSPDCERIACDANDGHRLFELRR